MNNILFIHSLNIILDISSAEWTRSVIAVNSLNTDFICNIAYGEPFVVGSAIPGLRDVPELLTIHPILPPTVHIHL